MDLLSLLFVLLCVCPPHSCCCMSGVQVGILVGVVSGVHSEIIPEMAWLSLRHGTRDTGHVTRGTGHAATHVWGLSQLVSR